MKMYKIVLRHLGPKSSSEGIVTYLIASSDEQVLRYIDKEYIYNSWQERDDDTDVEFSYLKKLLKCRGEYFDEDCDSSDAYYGIKHYGWEKGVAIDEEQCKILLKLKIAKDIRKFKFNPIG